MLMEPERIEITEEDLLDLIERAFREGQLDGEQMDMAWWLVEANWPKLCC